MAILPTIFVICGTTGALAQQSRPLAIPGVSDPSQLKGKPLAVLGLSCKMTYVGPRVQGIVRNISNVHFGQIEIQEIFSDQQGHFVSNNTTFLEFNPLLPGQTSTFVGFASNNPAIAFVDISVGLQDGPLIPSAGANFAHCY